MLSLAMTPTTSFFNREGLTPQRCACACVVCPGGAVVSVGDEGGAAAAGRIIGAVGIEGLTARWREGGRAAYEAGAVGDLLTNP